MSKMIERVAHVLEAAMRQGQDVTEPYCRLLARTAIEAMREPTDKMREAGAIVQADGHSAVTNALGTWQAMIDEALK